VDFWLLVTFSKAAKCFSEHWRFFSSASISLHLRIPKDLCVRFLCWEKLNLQICLFLFQCVCVAFFEEEVKVLFCHVIVVGERVEVEDLVWSWVLRWVHDLCSVLFEERQLWIGTQFEGGGCAVGWLCVQWGRVWEFRKLMQCWRNKETLFLGKSLLVLLLRF